MKTIKSLLWLAFIVALIIFSPLVTLWSINTLFKLAIPYEVETWFALFWLSMVTFGNVVNSIKYKK